MWFGMPSNGASLDAFIAPFFSVKKGLRGSAQSCAAALRALRAHNFFLCASTLSLNLGRLGKRGELVEGWDGVGAQVGVGERPRGAGETDLHVLAGRRASETDRETLRGCPKPASLPKVPAPLSSNFQQPRAPLTPLSAPSFVQRPLPPPPFPRSTRRMASL